MSSKVCVWNKTEDLNLCVLNMTTGINDWKHRQSIYHVNVNVNLMVENVIQIKSGVPKNTVVSVKIQKNLVCAKKITFRILLHVVTKMVNF